MDADNTEPEVIEAPSNARSNLVVILALAVLLGVLLASGAVGGYFYVQRSNEFEAKVLAMETSLQEKSQTIDGLQRQIEALSGQMHLLRDYAIARSTAASEYNVNEKKAESPATALQVVPSGTSTSATEPVAKDGASHDGTSHVKIIKPKPEEPKAENCDLVGKSPEEQVETLRRCVALMDSSAPDTKPRSR